MKLIINDEVIEDVYCLKADKITFDLNNNERNQGLVQMWEKHTPHNIVSLHKGIRFVRSYTFSYRLTRDNETI